MRTLPLILLLLVAATAGAQADTSAFERRLFIRGGDTLPYRILLPANIRELQPQGLVLFLHGSGERGRDNSKQLTHGARFFLADSNRHAIIVFPQCPESDSWSKVSSEGQGFDRTFTFAKRGAPTRSMRLLMGLLRTLQDSFWLDRDRMYIGGLSMGAMGTYDLVRRKPKMFKGAFAICGGADPAIARKLRHTKWWIFHGEKDDVVPPHYGKEMAEAIRKAGGNAKLTLYPEANHNSWDAAFAERELHYWLQLQFIMY